MNCLLETVASFYFLTRQVVWRLPEDDDSVEDGLVACRTSLGAREAELDEGCRRLGLEALRRKKIGDIAGARAKLLERRRGQKQLEKLRSSITLVDAQLDTLRSTELDRELMQTLLASSAALKKAGVGKGVKEAEAVMAELDSQMRESSEFTSVLSGNISSDVDLDIEDEFEALQLECGVDALEAVKPAVSVVSPVIPSVMAPVSVPSLPDTQPVRAPQPQPSPLLHGF
jgi:hypothetical protein